MKGGVFRLKSIAVLGAFFKQKNLIMLALEIFQINDGNNIFLCAKKTEEHYSNDCACCRTHWEVVCAEPVIMLIRWAFKQFWSKFDKLMYNRYSNNDFAK